MAEGKKSVLLYCDLIHTIDKMDDENAGQFFKHYLRYINDLDPKTDNQLVDITFESVKQNLKRDLKKWENRSEASRNNGKLGGRPPKEEEPKEPTRLNDNLTEPKKPVTVTDTVTDTDTDTDILKETKPETSKKEDSSKEINSDDSNKPLKKKERKKVAQKKETGLAPKAQKEPKIWDEEVLRCYEAIILLFSEHLRPKTRVKTEKWKQCIDRLKRIEQIPLKRVYQIVRSVREDDFWRKNFDSLLKLRRTNPDGTMYIVVFNEKFPNGQNKQDAKLEAQKAAYLANSNPNDLM